MAYSKAKKERAKKLYRLKHTVAEISQKLGISRDTLFRWKEKENWDDFDTESVVGLAAQIASMLEIVNAGEASEYQINQLDKLTRIYERLTRKQAKKEQKQAATNSKPVEVSVLGNVKSKFLDSLFSYQRDFVLDESRFKLLLKSRQIGFSYTTAGASLLSAMERELDQIVLSASQDQADLVRNYCRLWAEKLEIELVPDGKSLVAPGGKRIYFLPSNFRTVQGYSGDLWLDEFAWHMHPEKIYKAVLPTITIGDRRLVLMSTPYTQQDKFGEIWSGRGDDYDIYSAHKYTIHDAIAAGLEVNLADLRKLFDEETFRELYECQFFSDQMALFSPSDVRRAWDENCLRHTSAKVDGGMDIGRVRDLTGICLAERDKEQIVWIRHLLSLERQKYETQRLTTQGLFEEWNINRFRVDRTGIGDNLCENLQTRYGSRVEGWWFTREKKEELALAAARLFENGMIRIPNNRDLIAHLHAIKKKPTQTGFTYDSDRNEKVKHADMAWALFLSVYGFGGRERKISEKMFRIFGKGA